MLSCMVLFIFYRNKIDDNLSKISIVNAPTIAIFFIYDTLYGIMLCILFTVVFHYKLVMQ